MAVVIRMKRTGRRNRPCYRISVADRRFPRDGKTLETLGLYDPVSGNPEEQVRIDVERAKHWIANGAIPSETVASILRREGAFEGAPERQPRDRKGREGGSARGNRVRAAKKARAEAKKARYDERMAAKRAAAKAAAAPSDDAAEE